MSMLILTEPDTPLNDADHVGSFNLYGSEKMELKKHQVPMTIDEQVENFLLIFPLVILRLGTFSAFCTMKFHCNVNIFPFFRI